MTDVHVHKTHNLQIDVVRSRIDGVVQKLGKQYGIRGVWKGNTMSVSGIGLSRGITGSIDVSADSVVVFVVLPVLLSFMTSTITATVSHELDEALA